MQGGGGGGGGVGSYSKGAWSQLYGKEGCLLG